MISEKELEQFFEDDSHHDIPEIYLKMSPEQLRKLAEEELAKAKENPRFPKRKSNVKDGKIVVGNVTINV